MKHSFAICSLLLLLCLPGKTQEIQTSQIKAIAIGDTVPNFTLHHVLNFPKSTATLSEFKGKWLILDFWFVNCIPCVAMLPKTDSIEKALHGKVQFLPVNRVDKEDKITALFKRMKGGKGTKYPTAVIDMNTADSAVVYLFPNQVNPHYVWIDPNGVVRYITDQKQVTFKNVEAVVQGLNPIMPTKNDMMALSKEYVPYNSGLPLLIDFNGGGRKSFAAHSILAADLDIDPYYRYFSIIPERIIALRKSIMILHQIAFGNIIQGHEFTARYSAGSNNFVPGCKVAVEIKDTIKYSKNGSLKEYLDDARYSYEFLDTSLTLIKKGEVYTDEIMNTPLYKKRLNLVMNKMRLDLNLSLPIKAYLAKRNVSCYILKVKDKNLLSKNMSSSAMEIDYDKLTFLNIKGGTIVDFLVPFEQFYFNKPIIDETEFKQRINLSITTDLRNVIKVNDALRKYGLEFIVENRNIEMLILTDDENKLYD